MKHCGPPYIDLPQVVNLLLHHKISDVSHPSSSNIEGVLKLAKNSTQQKSFYSQILRFDS